MSITKGAMLISNANAVGTELVNQLGGTGYKPVEWADKINLLGINSVDAPYAIKSIQAGTYTGEERGAIQYSNCNAVGSMLNKKLNTNRGFKPVEWPSSINVLKPLTENTVTGDICNVSDGSEQVPLKSWSINIPANLTGKSTVVCNQGGKNFYPIKIGEDKFSNNGGASHSNDNGVLVINATTNNNCGVYILTSDTTCEIRNILKFFYDKNLPKTISFDVVSTSENTEVAVTSGVRTVYTVGKTPIRISHNSTGLNCSIYVQGAELGVSSTLRVSNFQIEYGSIAQTDYEPYTAPTVNTVDLGRTVYGADVDVANGTGNEDYNRYVVTDQETGDFLAGTNNNGYRIGIKISGAQTPLYTGGISNIGENKACLASHTWTIGSWCIYTDNKLYFVVPNEYTTFAMALQYLVDNNATFVFPLATPIDFTFDPITPTPETNTSVTNFWNDTGSNTITYYQAPTALTRSTVSGSIASFSDADTRLTCVNAIATIPPSIAGVDTVQLVRVGKNLANIGAVESCTNTGGVGSSITQNNDGSITIVTTTQQNVKSLQKFSDIFPNVKVGQTCILSATTTGTQKQIYLHGVSTVWVFGQSKTITEGMLTSEVSFYASGNNTTATVSNFQLEYGSSASSYVPYIAPTTYSANLGRTIHGGSVDFVNGDVVGDYGNINLGSLTWTYDSVNSRFQTVLGTVKQGSVRTTKFVCDEFTVIDDGRSIADVPDKSIYNGSGSYVYVHDSDYTDPTLFTNAVNGKYLTYPLATPTTASITGQAIIPKTGTNNCYNNVGGNTEITYFTNT